MFVCVCFGVCVSANRVQCACAQTKSCRIAFLSEWQQANVNFFYSFCYCCLSCMFYMRLLLCCRCWYLWQRDVAAASNLSSTPLVCHSLELIGWFLPHSLICLFLNFGFLHRPKLLFFCLHVRLFRFICMCVVCVCLGTPEIGAHFLEGIPPHRCLLFELFQMHCAYLCNGPHACKYKLIWSK